ncbi:class I SAM-dependent methyltransferase [Candidatus Woesebacteria bacterium]|nr:class I SAM-dependent methyltransferase [Candidatus Woesebacteria bacterium]
MVLTLVYLLAVGLLLCFLIFLSFFLLFLTYSWLSGAPFVPTKQKNIEELLAKAQIKKGAYMLELGCGDGRVLKTAAKLYGVRGLGIDVNHLLVIFARLTTANQYKKTLHFEQKNILDADLSQADYIYIFLFPELVDKIKDKLLNETKKGCIIISHGFRIPFLSNMQIGTLKKKPFTTYYYKISRK